MVVRRSLSTVLLLLCAVFTLHGQTARPQSTMPSMRISARQIFSGMESAPTVSVGIAAERRMVIDPAQTTHYLRSATSLAIADFPIAPQSDGEIVLRRSRPIVDARTQFLVATPGGDVKVRGPEIESFTGTIRGEEGSKVYMSFVGGQMIASIQHADGRVYVLGPSRESGADSREHLIVNARATDPSGGSFNCLSDEITADLPVPPPSALTPTVAATKKLLQVSVAVETDSEFFTATGSDETKAQAYAMAIFSMVSAIYEEEIGVTFYIPWMKTWTNSPRDPYDVKGDGYALPAKVLPYWRDNYANVKRDVGHVMTSIGYGGGGLGYMDALCGKNGDYGFSCSSVQSGHSYPTFAFTYDVYIVAHELGHNFNAPHTHSCYWGAPIDTCVVDEGIQGGCLPSDQQPKPNPGSIMSYCGGTNNSAGLGYTLRMTFLPRVAALMRQTAEQAACLDEPDAPTVALVRPHGQESFDGTSPIDITWKSAKVTSVNLEYSSDAGTTWNSIEGDLPAVDEHYSWNPSSICSRKMLVRLSDAANNDVADTSILTFSIVANDPSGLVAYYPFNGNADDETPCGLYPAAGNARLDRDRSGVDQRAYSFNGSSNLRVPEFTADFPAISISWWFNLSTTAGVQVMVSQNWEEGGTFAVHSWNGVLGGAFWTETSGIPFQVWGPGIQANKWYHAVITYDGKVSKVYLNGAEVGSADGVNTLAIRTAPMYIGSRGPQEYTSGSLDEVRIYRRALTLDDVKKLYNEGGAAPQAPTLTTPPNNATGQPVSVKLVWNGAPNSTHYHVQVATGNEFKEADLVLNDSTVATASRDIASLQEDRTYYWRVAAYNEFGKGGWSEAFAFTTGAPTAPQAPALVSPANGAVDQPTAVHLSWGTSANALRYHVQVASSSDFAAQSIGIDDQTITTTTFDISGLGASTVYYWHVAATNAVGTSDWSEPYSFTTQGATAVPGSVQGVAGLAPVVVSASGDRLTLRFGVPSARDAEIRLYDEIGREVRLLYSGHTDVGTQVLDVDTRGLGPGVYYCKLRADDLVASRKLVLVK